jgi:hypothetical protein
MFIFFKLVLHIYVFKFRFFYKILSLNFLFFLKKQTLFFKPKISIKLLNWKRLNFFLLRKKFFKKKIRKVWKRSRDSNFFFKKNFFSILIKTRSFFSNLLFNKKYKRQGELTNYFLKIGKYNFLKTNPTSLFIILLKSQFFLFSNDVLYFLKNGYVFLNRVCVFLLTKTISVNDVIQLQLRSNYFLYFKKVKIFFKKKLIQNKKLKKLFFFKILKKKGTFLKRRVNNFFNLFSFYKFNVPIYLELDFICLTVFLIKATSNLLYLNNFLFYRVLNTSMFKLLNFKKIT